MNCRAVAKRWKPPTALSVLMPRQAQNSRIGGSGGARPSSAAAMTMVLLWTSSPTSRNCVVPWVETWTLFRRLAQRGASQG